MHLLIIDDEPALREVLANSLARAGYTVEQAGGVKEAQARLSRGDVDIAICDIKMPDGNGIDLLKSMRAAGIDTPFLIITAFASVETAVESLRAGAADFITKPVRSEEMLHRVAQIAQLRGLREENRVLRKVVNERNDRLYAFRSVAMQDFDRLVRKVAPTESTVLITGESGTGKGVIAREIHERSPRAEGIFLPVNCGAIPENLLEAEFFGHTKGAFTGADRARKGLFLEADRGTLFLDEVGELPLHMQTKLLHVIEEKSVRAVGADTARKVDTRVIAATNRNLAEMVKAGRFREDLYFRLSMFQIHLPPLRERREDLPGLLRFILGNLRRASGGADIAIDPAAEEVLLAYSWPGNVRELENVLNRAHILADGDRIALADLPAEISRVSRPFAAAGTAVARDGHLRDQLRAIEASLVLRALEETNDDRRAAASRLGIGLSSLYRKLEEFERMGLVPQPQSARQSA
jgi:two-component system response regulator AtoC